MSTRSLNIALALAVALTLTACTASGPSASSPSTGTPVAAPSPSPSPTPQPLALARLAGHYAVRLFVVGNTFDSKPRRLQPQWTLSPTCDSGVCDTVLRAIMRFAAQRAGASNHIRVRLVHLSGTVQYQGLVKGFFATCGGKPNTDTWTFSIRVMDAGYLTGIWTATRWEGTWTRYAPGGGCIPGRLKAVVRGRFLPPGPLP